MLGTLGGRVAMPGRDAGPACAQALNPPLLGTLTGAAVGLSPVGSLLFAPASAAAADRAARLPLELLVSLGAQRGLQIWHRVRLQAWRELYTAVPALWKNLKAC